MVETFHCTPTPGKEEVRYQNTVVTLNLLSKWKEWIWRKKTGIIESYKRVVKPSQVCVLT